MTNSIWIGFDPREASAFAVTRHTVCKHVGRNVPVYGLVLSELQKRGLYYREMKTRINGEGRVEMIDVLSIREDYNGRISTQHALARFLVPYLAGFGWALFMDGDMMVRNNIGGLFDGLDRRFAAYCVKHSYEPRSSVKMDGQEQSAYARKNWTSFVVWNCTHPANRRLTLEMVNTLPGRDLHRLCWLEDEEIGELGPEWNYLVGYGSVPSPKVVHFTDGVPDMPGYEKVEFAHEWRCALEQWAAGNSQIVLERAVSSRVA